jgi:ABC-type multidrug transport system ATPase subunit
MESKKVKVSRLIYVKDIIKTYGKKEVLKGGELTAYKGKLVGIVGENGSGKSTLLKIIAGLVKADDGLLVRNGSMGYCPQEPLLYKYLTVREHFNLFGKAYGLNMSEIYERSINLMDTFSFNNYQHYKIHQLSGGTCQKLNLTLSLLHDPDLLLLDEPYAAFDWETYSKFINVVQKQVEKGKCIIMVSHLLYEKNQFDIVFELDNGVIHG